MPELLSEITREFEDEVDGIQEWFIQGCSASVVAYSPFPYAPLADGCLVSLWDAWSRFVRRLLLACACGPVEGLGGSVYRPSVERHEKDALRHLESERRNGGKSYPLAFGKTGEPKWYLVKHSFEIASTLDLENGEIIGAALTASQIHLSESISVSNPHDHLRKLRNYVAHKSDANFAKVCEVLPLSSYPDLDAFLRSRTQGGSQVFCDWADALVALGHGATL